MSRRTLLLTPWYTPKTILHWQDAIKMMYEETVDVVVSYDEDIRSPSVTWKMPAVVRLRKLARKTQRGAVKFSRQNVYARDRYTCQYCSNRFEHEDLSYDHVVPKSAGGRRTFTNIVTACKACNLRKANMTCDQAGMFPLRAPFEPKSLPLLGPRIDAETAPDEWQDYLGAWAK